jgi:23S rRNA (cytosine1962-C5)-methyltransferase
MIESDRYVLIDSGLGEKLEQIGPHLVVRPSPQALWPRTLDQRRWHTARARYLRSSSGGGAWEPSRALPDSWTCAVGSLRFAVRPTGFGHVGFFAEQAPFWQWLQQVTARAIATRGYVIEVLNLFAYTGGSSLAAARGGASVTHCDASKGVVQWASENVPLNGLQDASIRWIVDDAVKFLQREQRRERRYHAVVLDPPSFGRGPKGEIFKLEDGVNDLLDACIEVLDDEPAFVLFSAHTPGIGALALRHLLDRALRRRFTRPLAGTLAHGEMSVPAAESPYSLPSGTWTVYSRDGSAPDAQGPVKSAP